MWSFVIILCQYLHMGKINLVIVFNIISKIMILANFNTACCFFATATYIVKLLFFELLVYVAAVYDHFSKSEGACEGW